MFKLLVTGSRHWTDEERIRRDIRALIEEHGEILVIQGGAKGADALAAKVALQSNVHCATIPALWNRGRRAGPQRNAAMLALEPDLVLAYPLPGGSGTQDCMRQARGLGISVSERPRKPA